MKHLLAILLLAACAMTAQGQIIKSLGYNTTNGKVVYTGTNTLTFTNAFKLGDDLLLSNNVFHWGTNARWAPEDNVFSSALQFDSTNIAAATRTNISLGLPALTNTSNVTIMRALAGSTNTNQPFSGIIQYADSPTGDTFEMTVSNGIILKTEMQ